MVVRKPATERLKRPSVGRLGLFDPHAAENLALLGWYDYDCREHVDLLWSLSRAPDADAVLRPMVRLFENPATGWEDRKSVV